MPVCREGSEATKRRAEIIIDDFGMTGLAVTGSEDVLGWVWKPHSRLRGSPGPFSPARGGRDVLAIGPQPGWEVILQMFFMWVIESWGGGRTWSEGSSDTALLSPISSAANG